MRRLGRDLPAKWRAAIGLASGTVVFNAVMQIESYASSARAGSASRDAMFVFALPFLQLDALLLGVVLGGAYIVAEQPWMRASVVAAAVIANAWAIVNQVAYGILGHSVSVFDPDVSLRSLFADALPLAGSVVAEAGWIVILNLVLLTVGATWIVRRGWERDDEVKPPTVRPSIAPWIALAAVVYAAMSIGVTRVVDTRGLERHAFVALLTPVRTGASRMDPSLSDSVLYTPRFGVPASGASDGRLVEVVTRAHSLQRPNVLLVVLESVGGDQLFPDGVADSSLTPTIARLARAGVLFPNIYSVSPHTTRAHVPMMTGGPTMTWGDAGEQLTQAYVGVTLPGALRAKGYRTGLFAAADLRFAALEDFYRRLPWDTVLHYGDGSGLLSSKERVHSWGINEAHLWSHAWRWVDGAAAGRGTGPSRAPFFLNFQTISTHYPYGTPAGFRAPLATTSARSRYLNALAYTDAILGRMLTDLASRGDLDRTIVVITGDHGQAFADKHRQNVAHRNYVYEENIRSFLLVAVPGVDGPIVSARIGTHRDLMPSILALLGASATTGGQNLFAPDYVPRVVYFHKDVPPGLWGLRDGRWKFIDRMSGGSAELYDLEGDVDEQTNVAAQHAAMIAEYRALAGEWYARTNYEFLAHLEGYDSTQLRAMRGRRLRRGLRDVRVGVASRGGLDFTETAVLERNVQPSVSLRWYWLDRETPVRVRLVSPRRRFWISPVVVEHPWSSINVIVPFAADQPGRWTVDVWSGSRRLGRTTFDVR